MPPLASMPPLSIAEEGASSAGKTRNPFGPPEGAPGEAEGARGEDSAQRRWQRRSAVKLSVLPLPVTVKV